MREHAFRNEDDSKKGQLNTIDNTRFIFQSYVSKSDCTEVRGTAWH